MTYLLDDIGNEIVLNTEVTVTKQVLSFFDFKIKGNFSTNFSIPNTSATRRSLGYYGVNQSEKVAFSRQAWGLYKDGNLLTRGFLVIQGENKTELDCFFASGNASWITSLTGNLRELNWSDYDQDFTITNLASLRTSTTGMVFPLMDCGYNFKKGNTDFCVFDIRDSANDPQSFIYDFYPAFYLKSIIQEIATQKQIKITGNIFEDARFNQSVIPLPGIDRSLKDPVYMTDTDSYASDQYIASGATVTVTFGYESNSDGLLDLGNGRIQNDGISRNFRIRIAFDFNGPFSGEVYLRKNGATVYTYTFTIASFLRYQVISLAAGDYLDVQVKNNGGSTQSITKKYFGYQLCGSWYEAGLKILAKDVVPNTKILDLLKYVVQAYNCIVSFDDFSRTIRLNKIDSVRKEDATDLTETVVDYDIEWQNDFAVNNYVRTNQTADIEPFNNQELKFGEFVFDGPDNGKAEDDVMSLKFGPSLVKQQERGYFNWHLTNIPLFNLEDDGDPISYTTVTNSGGNAVFNFSALDVALPTKTIIRIDDDNDLYNGYFVISSDTTTSITLYHQLFLRTSTGTIRKQKIQFPISAGFRVLLNIPNYTLSKIGLATIQASAVADNVRLVNSTTTADYSSWNVAYYYIPDSDFAFSDELKLGLHPGSIDGAVSIPLSTQYYNRLKRIARNPLIKTKFRISETLFNTIDLSEFVYIDIGKWSGYFFIQKIDGYKDSITTVKGELLKVD